MGMGWEGALLQRYRWTGGGWGESLSLYWVVVNFLVDVWGEMPATFNNYRPHPHGTQKHTWRMHMWKPCTHFSVKEGLVEQCMQVMHNCSRIILIRVEPTCSGWRCYKASEKLLGNAIRVCVAVCGSGCSESVCVAVCGSGCSESVCGGVGVGVCVRARVCAHVCVHMCVHAHVWVCAGGCSCVCMHVHASACICVCMHVCVCMYVRSCVCACTYVHMCVYGGGRGTCIQACMYLCACKHTSTLTVHMHAHNTPEHYERGRRTELVPCTAARHRPPQLPRGAVPLQPVSYHLHQLLRQVRHERPQHFPRLVHHVAVPRSWSRLTHQRAGWGLAGVTVVGDDRRLQRQLGQGEVSLVKSLGQDVHDLLMICWHSVAAAAHLWGSKESK